MVEFDNISFAVLGTSVYGVNPDETGAFRMLDRYLERGGNIIDTARCYSDWIPGEKGRSESLLGRWIKSRRNRDTVFVSTKGGHPPMDDFSRPRLSPEELAADLEASRRALGVDCIDLYWLHRDDTSRPVEALLETLEIFRENGRIRYYGASNFSPERLREAAVVSEENGWQGFSGNQPMGCLGIRFRKPVDIPLLKVLDDPTERFQEKSGSALFPYTSQAAGYYEKALRLGPEHPSLAGHPFNTPGCNRIAGELKRLSRESGYSVSALVLAWWRTKTCRVHPLIGCRTIEQLDDSLQALTVPQDVLNHLAGIDPPT
jgi:aryl-alcohol dehydrogenase-like predicted oxidoreductase